MGVGEARSGPPSDDPKRKCNERRLDEAPGGPVSGQEKRVLGSSPPRPVSHAPTLPSAHIPRFRQRGKPSDDGTGATWAQPWSLVADASAGGRTISVAWARADPCPADDLLSRRRDWPLPTFRAESQILSVMLPVRSSTPPQLKATSVAGTLPTRCCPTSREYANMDSSRVAPIRLKAPTPARRLGCLPAVAPNADVGVASRLDSATFVGRRPTRHWAETEKPELVSGSLLRIGRERVASRPRGSVGRIYDFPRPVPLPALEKHQL